MSDDRRTFKAKTDAMFDAVEEQVADIAKLFQVKVVTAVIIATYGPGNQWHATPYIATGRLRAGWRWSLEEPPATVSQADGGPFDASGAATTGRLSLKIMQGELPAVSWAWNNVLYAWLVHEGKGGHKDIGPRPWVEEIANRGQHYLDEARRDRMAGER